MLVLPAQHDRPARERSGVGRALGGALCTLLFCALLIAVFSGLALFLSMALTQGSPAGSVLRYTVVAIISIVPAQAAMALAAITARRAEGSTARAALGLVRPACRPAHVALFVLGAIGMTLVGVVLMLLVQQTGLIGPVGAGRQAFAELFGAAPAGVAVAMVAMASVLPGVCEELLFRGCIQRRLVGVMGPAAAILTSTICFALFHLDPAYMVFTLPVGAWLGYIAWRTGSIIPGMICHACVNALFSSLMALGDRADGPFAMIGLALLASCALVGIGGSVLVLRKLPNPKA